MARVKRFKILETATRKYKATATDPASPFYKYKQFKAGNVTLTFTGTAQGSREQVGISAFGLPGNAPAILTVASGRATEPGSYTLTGVTAALLGHADLAVNGNLQPNASFIPAKAIIKAGTVTKVTSGVSGITGIARNYKKQPSYTYPFGKVAAADTQVERMRAIVTAVEAGAADRTVTFQPERFFV